MQLVVEPSRMLRSAAANVGFTFRQLATRGLPGEPTRRTRMVRIVPPRQLGIILWLALEGFLLNGYLAAAQAAQQPAPPPGKESATATPDVVEQNALNEAFRSAQSNPQILIKNLAAFLDRFPHSSRRDLVLRTICTYGQQANAPAVVVQYGQMLLQSTPQDPRLLSMLVEALAQKNDQSSRITAIDYISRLIKIEESEREKSAGDAKTTSEQLTETIAALYAERAGFYRDSGNLDKGLADDERSYTLFPSAHAAAQLGDDEMSKGDDARALDYYLTAFAYSGKNLDPERRRDVRLKLGRLYKARHHSEKGLGDLLLARYDSLMPDTTGRATRDAVQNLGRRDPFAFVLERIDGTPLPLAPYRGKVMVADFWATWCGPCRMQGKLVDEVAENFRANADVAFLAINVDQDRSGVPAFLQKAGWTVPAAYAQGLDQLLSVRELPTLVIFDRGGRVTYRAEGVVPGTFSEDLLQHLRETLAQPAPAPAASK